MDSDADGDGLTGPTFSGGNTSASFIRIISLSIALYDYLLTLPAEWRFYSSQRSWRLSLGCSLFIAIRYSSIAVLVLSNVGYFGNFFTPSSCARYYIAPPIFKVIQTMVSQLILGIRTINISRRSNIVTWIIACAFFSFTTAQWFLNLWNRVPIQGRHNNCTAGNTPPVLTVWLYYLLSMAYDVLTLGISTVYLVSFNPNSGKMLTDGLVYFVALTGVNILNLILYRRPDEAFQSSGVSLGYTLTWIMSQRILIHLRDAAAAHNRTPTTHLVVSVSRALPASHSAVARAMRSAEFSSSSASKTRSSRPSRLSAFDRIDRIERHVLRGGRNGQGQGQGQGQGYGQGQGRSDDRTALSTGFDVDPMDGELDWSFTSSFRGRDRDRDRAEREDGRERDLEKDGERSLVNVSMARTGGGTGGGHGGHSGHGGKGGAHHSNGQRGTRTAGSAKSACGCSCDCGWGSARSEGSTSRGDSGIGRGTDSIGGSGNGSRTETGAGTSSRSSGSDSHRQKQKEGGKGRAGRRLSGLDERDGWDHEDEDEEGDVWERIVDGDEDEKQDRRNRYGYDYDYEDDDEKADEDEEEDEERPEVLVQIEETVTVEVAYDPEARESYRTPRVLWGAQSRRGGDGDGGRNGGSRSRSRRGGRGGGEAGT
ncbi:hypothetical protein GY45DRAFT_1377252 [Cubamyces sp. BRFM 1775]|nr:hypothetical protein GY45DRAFT_1377252 [Cubamyces sp. BRFM 1775]